MIAVVDEFQGSAFSAAPAENVTNVTAVVTLIDFPPAALPKLRALLVVTQAAARARRAALRAISCGKPADEVIPLLRAHERLVQKQTALAEAIATVLAAAA